MCIGVLIVFQTGCLTAGIKGAFGIVTGILSSKMPPINIHLFNDATAMRVLEQTTYESDEIIGATKAIQDKQDFNELLKRLEEEESG